MKRSGIKSFESAKTALKVASMTFEQTTAEFVLQTWFMTRKFCLANARLICPIIASEKLCASPAKNMKCGTQMHKSVKNAQRTNPFFKKDSVLPALKEPTSSRNQDSAGAVTKESFGMRPSSNA